MKKKLLKSIVALVVIVVISLGMYYSSSQSSCSDLMFENIEALASAESGSGNKSCLPDGYACSIFDMNNNGIFHSLKHYPYYF